MACHINIVNVLRTAGFILLPVLASLCSCRRSGSEAERVIKEWIGKEIVFPDSMVLTVQGDTVDYRWQDAEYKIVTFVDSAGCTECKLKLPMWLQTYEMLQADADIALIMIIASNDTKKINTIFKRHDFPLPIYINKDNSFAKLNENLQTSDNINTFLLDNDNRVIAIGSPVVNNAVYTLYHSLTHDNDNKNENHSNEIYAPMQISNIGIVKTPKTTEFELINQGSSPIVISKILTSCACTKVKIVSDTILPKRSAMLIVTQLPDSIKGEFTREINVYFRDTKKFITLNVKGFM